MTVFISHNSRDKDLSRILGTRLAGQGINVWFDEWKLRPGDSITGGIEAGIKECSVFVLVWSAHARKSKWVTAELRAMIVRRIANAKLRIVPVMLDDTPLPTLVADYLGFKLARVTDLKRIAAQIGARATSPADAERLRRRYLELVAAEFPFEDSIRALICPRCGSKRLMADSFRDPIGGQLIYEMVCAECGLRHGTIAKRRR